MGDTDCQETILGLAREEDSYENAVRISPAFIGALLIFVPAR